MVYKIYDFVYAERDMKNREVPLKETWKPTYHARSVKYISYAPVVRLRITFCL